ncbi:thiamine ABC transporter permease [Thermoclostridium stercorarium subsp. thermolacticum DSM 2910]|jgi:ATP-binding cassette subfamily B protein|nr:ABC transporter ATP-binding protein [Thermoclostridium stercorarium]AGI39693.1 ABC transporter ATPase/permease subunit [Thermoclostridium stercorarium subsp. stercorarium DSM 8532]ANW99019.1 thiamine ABC transporter permease [Thermoclostridium stercorarium subsp. thermolacticum DSM 2910]ANX01547.1 thiamine ABC transporter permease [Thermoclostridium stercorarium subsp. leptospartum DSM 9219]
MEKIKKFIAYYRPYKGMFFMDMFCALVLSAIDLFFPKLVQYLLDEVYGKRPPDMIKIILLAGLGLLALYIIRYFCQRYITAQGHIMGARMEADMRRDLFSHLQKLSFSFYDNANTGTLMSRMTNDLFDISELAHHGPEDLFISVIKIAGAVVIMLTMNVKLTIILLLLISFIIVFTANYNLKMRAVFADNRRKIALVNAQTQDTLEGIRVVKSFSNEKIEQQKFDRSNHEFLNSKESNYTIMGKFFSGNQFLQGVLYLTVLVIGGIFLSHGSISSSELVAYILFINVFLNPIDKLVNFTEQYQKGMAGFERFLEILNTKPEIEDSEDAEELTNVEGEIRFNNVSFSYNGKKEVLKNINLTIPKGKTVALVGPSGSGKTTFCNLIPRFYEVDEGSITIDGKDIRKVTLESLRRNIGMVQQDVYLFSGTVKENILYGKPDATDEEVIQAAKLANAHDFIMELENGYDTFVGERGVKLSGGQKQRISIARAFLKNPPILILDEATSALDNESERLVQQALDVLAKGRTTLIIAHRLSTVKNADRIVVLTSNGIEEEGTHDELINKGGVYASLYKEMQI